MGEDLRQMHTEGRKIQRGPVRVVDVSGIKPGTYGKYAGNTVVPRSTDSGRMDNGAVFTPVRRRVLDEDFRVIEDKMVVNYVDPQQRPLGAPSLEDGMIGTPHRADEEAAARIRAVLADDQEIEAKLELERRIREEIAEEHKAKARRRFSATEELQQLHSEQQPDLQEFMSQCMGMLQDMKTGFQQQIDDLRLDMFQPQKPEVRRPQESVPVPRAKPQRQGMIPVAYSGDFGTIRTAYQVANISEDCIVLGNPNSELQSYDPPVNPEKPLKLTITGDVTQTFKVVHAGLSFDYKGDRLTVLLMDHSNGNSKEQQ